MSAYRRDFDETKYMSFLIKDNELLEKYKDIGKKISKSNKIEQIYNENSLNNQHKFSQ